VDSTPALANGMVGSDDCGTPVVPGLMTPGLHPQCNHTSVRTSGSWVPIPKSVARNSFLRRVAGGPISTPTRKMSFIRKPWLPGSMFGVVNEKTEGD